MHAADGINMALQEVTLAEALRAAGYRTALFGKWHLGIRPEHLPGKHGFNHFFGISPGAADYIDHRYFSDQPILYEDTLLVEKEGYLTDLITDYTVDFIKKKLKVRFNCI